MATPVVGVLHVHVWLRCAWTDRQKIFKGSFSPWPNPASLLHSTFVGFFGDFFFATYSAPAVGFLFIISWFVALSGGSGAFGVKNKDQVDLSLGSACGGFLDFLISKRPYFLIQEVENSIPSICQDIVR